jgi:predicted ATPase
VLQAVAEYLADFPDGVFFVPLAPLTETRLVPSAIASALGLRGDNAVTVAEICRRLDGLLLAIELALAWAESCRKSEIGLRLGLAFGVLALQRGTPAEGREWLRRVRALDGGDAPLQAQALTTLGWVSLFQGDAEAAMAAVE